MVEVVRCFSEVNRGCAFEKEELSMFLEVEG